MSEEANKDVQGLEEAKKSAELSSEDLARVTGGADNAGTGKVSVQDFHFTKVVDKSSA
jgi:type VI protein secretion system component Hcp